jgi:RHH-type proline utilization regulon transcriptional repressor/proline dehydrogenase/delta 1-pyrroline-5-carboxylate dehydrogenase
VIDREAFDGIQRHLQRLNAEAKALVTPARPAQEVPNLVPPHAYEVPSIDSVTVEIFGPVLHVVRWSGEPQTVIDRINALGFGLTLGIQTRIDSRAQAMAARAHVGNIYVNRNIIGAVVGVQPFGGEGLSGTGPKAGGPHYLLRFCAEQTLTINTTAAGGNAALLAASA